MAGGEGESGWRMACAPAAAARGPELEAAGPSSNSRPRPSCHPASHLRLRRRSSTSGWIWCSSSGTVRDRLTWYRGCASQAAPPPPLPTPPPLPLGPPLATGGGSGVAVASAVEARCTMGCRPGNRVCRRCSRASSASRQSGGVVTARGGRVGSWAQRSSGMVGDGSSSSSMHWQCGVPSSSKQCRPGSCTHPQRTRAWQTCRRRAGRYVCGPGAAPPAQRRAAGRQAAARRSHPGAQRPEAAGRGAPGRPLQAATRRGCGRQRQRRQRWVGCTMHALAGSYYPRSLARLTCYSPGAAACCWERSARSHRCCRCRCRCRCSSRQPARPCKREMRLIGEQTRQLGMADVALGKGFVGLCAITP